MFDIFGVQSWSAREESNNSFNFIDLTHVKRTELKMIFLLLINVFYCHLKQNAKFNLVIERLDEA